MGIKQGRKKIYGKIRNFYFLNLHASISLAKVGSSSKRTGSFYGRFNRYIGMLLRGQYAFGGMLTCVVVMRNFINNYLIQSKGMSYVS